MTPHSSQQKDLGGVYQKYRGFNVDLQMFPQLQPSDKNKDPTDLTKLFYGNDHNKSASNFANDNLYQSASNLTAKPLTDNVNPPFFDISDFEIKPKQQQKSRASQNNFKNDSQLFDKLPNHDKQVRFNLR